MAEIVNLRRVKKQRARDKAAAEAEANRAKHGLTPTEREAQARTAAKARRELDQAKLEE